MKRGWYFFSVVGCAADRGVLMSAADACGIRGMHANDDRSVAGYIGRVHACGVHELHSND